MNWKKIFAFTALSGVAAGAQNAVQSGHITVGSFVTPFLATILPTLAALFTKPPHQE